MICNNTSKGVLNTLQFVLIETGQTSEQRVTMSPLGFEPSLAHFDRQLVTVDEPLPQTFLPGLVLQMFISFVLQLLVILHKFHSCLLT